MKELISLIIPIYNVENYVEDCIKSVISQTYKNIEIILVNDGSTDNSIFFCEHYKNIDNRIKVINKKNGGLSDARNKGMDIATGEYYIFIDGDDFVGKYYVENLYNAIKETNSLVACSGFIISYNYSKVRFDNDYKYVKKYSSFSAIKKLLYQDEIDFSAWAKIYHKSIFFDMRYPYKKTFEDIMVTYNAFKKSNNIAIISEKNYAYVQRKNSIMNKDFNIEKLEAINQMNILIKNVKNDYPELLKAVNSRYVNTLFNIIFQVNKKNYSSIFNYLWMEIKKNRKYVIFNKHSRLSSKFACVISYMGYNITFICFKLSKLLKDYRF